MKRKILAVLSLVTACMMITISCYAHSGRTDSSGGHRDNKNKSGLGSYHYHCGGNPPHLHTNGCPYNKIPASSSSSSSSSSAPQQPTAPKMVYASRINAVEVPQTVKVGESANLKGSVYPANAEDQSISWSSETPEIATVSSGGTLYAKEAGTAVIVAATERGTKSKFTIKITEVVAESINIKNKISSLVNKKRILCRWSSPPKTQPIKMLTGQAVMKAY